MAPRKRKSEKEATEKVNPAPVEEHEPEIEDENIEDDTEEDEDSEDFVLEEDDVVWPAAKEANLIRMWQETSHLYDDSVEGYKKKAYKDKALAKFSRALGIGVGEVETRMTTLRTAYSKFRKGPKSGSGRKKLTPRQQYIVDKLYFISDHVKPRRTRSSLSLKNKNDSELMEAAIAAQRQAEEEAANTLHQIQQDEQVAIVIENNPENPDPSPTGVDNAAKQAESRQPVFDENMNDPLQQSSTSEEEVLTQKSTQKDAPKGGKKGVNAKKKIVPQVKDTNINVLPGTKKPPGQPASTDPKTKLQKLAEENISRTTRGRPKKQVTNSQVANLLVKRNDLITDVAAAIKIPRSETPTVIKETIPMEKKEDDAVNLWSRLLATKIRRFSTIEQEELMVRIDMMMLDELKKKNQRAPKRMNIDDNSSPSQCQEMGPPAEKYMNRSQSSQRMEPRYAYSPSKSMIRSDTFRGIVPCPSSSQPNFLSDEVVPPTPQNIRRRSQPLRHPPSATISVPPTMNPPPQPRRYTSPREDDRSENMYQQYPNYYYD